MQSADKSLGHAPSGSKLLAQHYFLDSLDLHCRFLRHWEEQPRKSSKVKSFIDLMMACECLLKAQYLLCQTERPLAEAYSHIKKLGHNIVKLSRAAEEIHPLQAHEDSRLYFGQFSVGLRYSAESHHFFFPIKNNATCRPTFSTTLGNSVWIQGANDVVVALTHWCRPHFTGIVTGNIDEILLEERDIESVMIKPMESKR